MKLTKELLDGFVKSKPWAKLFIAHVNNEKVEGYDAYVERIIKLNISELFIFDAFTWPKYENIDGKSYSWVEISKDYLNWLYKIEKQPEPDTTKEVATSKQYYYVDNINDINLLEEKGGIYIEKHANPQIIKCLAMPINGGIIQPYNGLCYVQIEYIKKHGEKLSPKINKTLLDAVEFRFLKDFLSSLNVIVLSIRVHVTISSKYSYLIINYKNIVNNTISSMTLPCFESGSMYKGLIIDKEYTPEELHLI